VDVSCPFCGAKLEIETAQSFVTCEHCGKQIFVDDEVERIEHHFSAEGVEDIGYQFEKGRLKAQKDAQLDCLRGQQNTQLQPSSLMDAQAFNWKPYVPDEGIKEMFLRYDNRLNRKRYIMRALALGAAVMVVCLVLGVILGMAGMSDSAIGTMGTLIGLGAGIIGLMLAIRRLHDLDRPTWWIIGNFIPFVNVIFGFYLLLAKGTEGPNQFGPDPLEGLH
jgi:uncharacterized membrane protein YhaH (DUF805 family)/DNA-directed RNA polymerase subunit RPC12/RpoP